MKNIILIGDALQQLKSLPDESVDCIVTSPPYYGLRDYGVDGQIGLEETPEQYIEKLVIIFRELRRVLKSDGTCWLNIGDSYAARRSVNGDSSFSENTIDVKGQARAGLSKDHAYYKPKDLMMIPARVAIALQMDGWWLRNDIIWHKPNPMPESVTDRCTRSHEHVYLLTKSARYWYDADAIREPLSDSGSKVKPFRDGDNSTLRRDNGNIYNPPPCGANKRDVWSITTKPFKGAHYACMPVDLAETCIKAGCKPGGVVLDPLGGAGTTAIASINENRNYLLIELSGKYVGIALDRIRKHRLELNNADPSKPIVYDDGSKQLSLFPQTA